MEIKLRQFWTGSKQLLNLSMSCSPLGQPPAASEADILLPRVCALIQEWIKSGALPDTPLVCADAPPLFLPESGCSSERLVDAMRDVLAGSVNIWTVRFPPSS